jgi:hypothetical protein
MSILLPQSLSQYTFQKQDDITEILLKVALITTILTPFQNQEGFKFQFWCTFLFIYSGEIFL